MANDVAKWTRILSILSRINIFCWLLSCYSWWYFLFVKNHQMFSKCCLHYLSVNSNVLLRKVFSFMSISVSAIISFLFLLSAVCTRYVFLVSENSYSSSFCNHVIDLNQTSTTGCCNFTHSSSYGNILCFSFGLLNNLWPLSI